MSEELVARSLLAHVNRILTRQRARRATTIRARFRPWLGGQMDVVSREFRRLAAHTAAGEAELILRCSPARLHCRRCDDEFFSEQEPAACPRCGCRNQGGEQIGELRLESVTIE